MLARSIAMMAALAAGYSPCLAADLGDASNESGARHSGAVVGAYFRMPLDPPTASRAAPRAGLRLAMTHDYRTPSAPGARFIEADGIDLRFTGAEATLYLAGRPMTGKLARLEASGGGGRVDTIMIAGGIALAVVAGVVVATSLD